MSAATRSGVNRPLTTRTTRPPVENSAFASFGRRIIAAAGRRVAARDVDALPDLAALATDVDTALAAAVTGLRGAGYSWAEIAARPPSVRWCHVTRARHHPPGRAPAMGPPRARNSAMSTAPAPTLPAGARWAGANIADLVRRAGSPDYPAWQGHIRAAAGCAHPIRLRGDLHTVEPATGRITATTGTASMPDGVLYVPCGNRRAVVCPSCAETYRADTFQLVKAGLAGGKGVPDTVSTHPCVFLTGTAPAFGPVHTHNRDGRPCRPRRNADTCPHGVLMECRTRHTDTDRAVGRPL